MSTIIIVILSFTLHYTTLHYTTPHHTYLYPRASKAFSICLEVIWRGGPTTLGIRPVASKSFLGNISFPPPLPPLLLVLPTIPPPRNEPIVLKVAVRASTLRFLPGYHTRSCSVVVVVVVVVVLVWYYICIG